MIPFALCRLHCALVYLKSTAQAVVEASCGFVFSNGHGIAAFTDWYDDLGRLNT